MNRSTNKVVSASFNALHKSITYYKEVYYEFSYINRKADSRSRT